MKKDLLEFDEINYWSEVKLDIVSQYASEYSKILTAQAFIKEHVYIDGFAGAGKHVSKATGKPVAGSPLLALDVRPPFKKYFFVDLKKSRTDNLKTLSKNHSNVTVHHGDCSKILLEKVFPNLGFKNYRRGLCLLDPYGLHLDWQVLKTAGEMKTIEIFLNFPVMDMNQNVLWRQPEKVSSQQIERMNKYWGDESWRTAAYQEEPNLFNFPWLKKELDANEKIAEAFKKRLKEVAGFSCVPDPIPMRNSKGAIVYYLFYASPNKTGEKIVKHLFNKHKDRGAGSHG